MNSYYTVKVKFTKEFQDGSLKRVTEPYLVNALSFSEAESRIYIEVGEFIRGECIVTDISRTDFADIFHYEDADVWYKCKVSYITEDADSGKEKKVDNDFLVSAHDVKEAHERIEESLKGLMASYSISKVEKMSIVEIFPFEDEKITAMKKGKVKVSSKVKKEVEETEED